MPQSFSVAVPGVSDRCSTGSKLLAGALWNPLSDSCPFLASSLAKTGTVIPFPSQIKLHVSQSIRDWADLTPARREFWDHTGTLQVS